MIAFNVAQVKSEPFVNGLGAVGRALAWPRADRFAPMMYTFVGFYSTFSIYAIKLARLIFTNFIVCKKIVDFVE